MPEPRYQNFRIALSEADLSKGYFPIIKVPPPELVNFRPYSQEVKQLNGGFSQQGFINCTLLWKMLDRQTVNKLRRTILLALDEITPQSWESTGDGYLYMTIDRLDGTQAGEHWIDVRGIPKIPTPQTKEGITGKAAFKNFTIFLNAIEILNDPAIF